MKSAVFYRKHNLCAEEYDMQETETDDILIRFAKFAGAANTALTESAAIKRKERKTGCRYLY